MLKVALAAQCSNQTIYNWYGSKPKFLAVLVDRYRMGLEKSISAACEVDGGELVVIQSIGIAILKASLSPESVGLIRARIVEEDYNATSAEHSRQVGEITDEVVKPVLHKMFKSILTRKGVKGINVSEIVDTFLDLLLGDLVLRKATGDKVKTTKKVHVIRARKSVERICLLFSELRESE